MAIIILDTLGIDQLLAANGSMLRGHKFVVSTDTIAELVAAEERHAGRRIRKLLRLKESVDLRLAMAFKDQVKHEAIAPRGGLQLLGIDQANGVFTQLSTQEGRKTARLAVLDSKREDRDLSFATFDAGDQTTGAVLLRLLKYVQGDESMTQVIEKSLDDFPLIRASILLLRDHDTRLRSRAGSNASPKELVNDFWDINIVALGAYADFVVTDQRRHDIMNRLRAESPKEFPLKARTKLQQCVTTPLKR